MKTNITKTLIASLFIFLQGCAYVQVNNQAEEVEEHKTVKNPEADGGLISDGPVTKALGYIKDSGE